MAQELLAAVKDGAVHGNIQLTDVEAILSNEVFTAGEGLLTTTENKSTLMHLAAQSKDETLLPLVYQAYKRAKFFPRVMEMKNNKDKTPIHIAIRASHFQNTVLLYKECQDLCPDALNADENGWTLMHSAVESVENLNIVKFLLSQEKCKPMLISQFTPSGETKKITPLSLAKELVQKHMIYVKSAEFGLKNLPSTFDKDSQYAFTVEPKKRQLEKAKELLSLIEQPTMELLAEESKRIAKELEKQKTKKRQNQINSEINELIQAGNWEAVKDKYLLADVEETRRFTVSFLAEELGTKESSTFSLPPLSERTLRTLMDLLKSPSSKPEEDDEDKDAVMLSTLKLLGAYVKMEENAKLIGELQESLPVISKVVDTLCSKDINLQCLCVSVLSNFFSNLPKDYPKPSDDPDIIEPLLLVKHFSLSERAKVLAAKALMGLQIDPGKEPDPGTWSVKHVSFWMESITEIENKSEYRKRFSDAGIDGLHLLELSSLEMTGLGVKFVSHQRKLSALIDDLRRRNMRSIVGKKDVFLSYAHININFARRIKKVLNSENYTVWIDEAGIRAGHKWRNEIADGIQNASCFLFILTPRSANSEYCQDEVALAEEYHKPIMTIKLEDVAEMDPGLKLIIQRRQIMDFTQESSFQTNKKTVISAIQSTIGEGSGPEIEDSSVTEVVHSPDIAITMLRDVSSSSGEQQLGVTESMMNGEALKQLVREVLAEDLGQVREEMRVEISRLDLRLEELSKEIMKLASY